MDGSYLVSECFFHGFDIRSPVLSCVLSDFNRDSGECEIANSRTLFRGFGSVGRSVILVLKSG